MIKILAISLSLAIATTAAIAALPAKFSETSSVQRSNAAAKTDRLDRPSAKADRLPVPGLNASLLVTGPVLLASVR